jgi:hypothetical protein
MTGETEFNGVKYRIGTLDARKQWNVARRILPLLAKINSASDLVPADLRPSGEDSEQVKEEKGQKLMGVIFGPLGNALAEMPDETSDYIIDTCLSVVMRASGPGWAPLYKGKTLMFQDIDLPTMMGLTMKVIDENLGGFFYSNLTDSPAASKAQAQG